MNGFATVSGTVYGGYTNVANGKATGNEVTIEKVIMGNVVGGSGTAANGTGTTSIGNFSGIQNLHFNLENAPTSNANPLLKITNVAGEKSLSNINLAVHRSGAT